MKSTPIGDFKEHYRMYEQEKQGYHESFHAPDVKILVVDDNDMNLFVAKSLLKKTLIQVSTCQSGAECLDLLRQNEYHVVLLDHMMPGMDGIETLKQAKEMFDNKSKNATYIALTANAILGVREMYLSNGFDDYISKPINGKTLEAMLRKYIPKELIQKTSTDAVTVEEKESVTSTEFSGELLDISLGLTYSAESEEMYREFLKMFCDMKNERLESLEESFKAEDWKNYTVFVHALKSTSLSIGGKTISELAAKLEQAGKNGEYDFIKENHAQAMRLYQDTVAEGIQYLGMQNA